MVWGALLGGLGTTAAAWGGTALLDGLQIHPFDPIIQGIKGAIPKTEATLDEENGTITTKEGRTYGIDSPQAMDWFGLNSAKFAERKAARAKEAKLGKLERKLEQRDADATTFTHSTIKEGQNIARGTLANARHNTNVTAGVTTRGQDITRDLGVRTIQSNEDLQESQHKFDQPMQQAQIEAIRGNLRIADRNTTINERNANWNMAQQDYGNRVQYALANNALDNQQRNEFMGALANLADALVPTNINIRRR
jgi:hypothetical protein